MKNFRLVVIVIVTLGFSLSTYGMSKKDPGTDLIEGIKVSADSFGIAVEIRNFKMAKDQLNAFFPLIKKEMKLAKKRYTELQKAGEKAEAKEEKIRLKRKEQIFDQLHAIVDVSPAALRVRSMNVKALVDEYVTLLPEETKLVSSSN